VHVDLYGYVQNNPVNFIDPMGLRTWYDNIIDEVREKGKAPTNYPDHWTNNPNTHYPYNKKSWETEDLPWLEKQSCELQKTIDAVETFNSIIQPPIQALTEEVLWGVHPVLGIGAKAVNFIIGATPAY